jgi:hypothetical protein
VPRLWTTLICLALAAGASAQEVGRTNVKGTDIVEYQLPQPDGPAVDYFIARTKAPAPLVLLIQGSGCGPVFTPHASHVFGFLDTAWTGKYAAMVVNKPYAAGAAGRARPAHQPRRPDQRQRADAVV